jgi:hypothetical protein
MEMACQFSSRVRISGERKVKSLLPCLYACNNCQEPLNGYLCNFEVIFDHPVRTAISYSLTYSRRTIIPTYVELPQSRLIHTYHAAPMPFPCHAVPLRLYIVSFPFDLHSAAVFDSHMQCRVRAMPRPCRSESYVSRPRHSAAWAWHV